MEKCVFLYNSYASREFPAYNTYRLRENAFRVMTLAHVTIHFIQSDT